MIRPSGIIRHSPGRETGGGDWRDQAACRGVEPELFDPYGMYGSGAFKDAIIREALAVCAACPVRAQCLEANLEDKWLIVGGTTPEQRERIRRNAARKSRADLKPCGTTAAYYRHIRAGEAACEPCRTAQNAANRARRVIAAEAKETA